MSQQNLGQDTERNQGERNEGERSEGERSDDRRVNLRIRERFVEVYDILEPFFDPANAWAGHIHEHLAFRALHERFPDMSGEEVLIIVTAAKRVFASGRKPTP